MNIIITLLVLGVIIFIHELGHFMAAKFFNMPVEEFAIGMGPAIYTRKGENTDYSIRSIPMGGYVNIKGMEVDSKVENGFNSKPAYQRFIVLIAGVVMNFLLAYVIIFLMVLLGGQPIPSEEAVVGEISKNSKAVKILEKGDKILALNGVEIKKWEDLGRVNKELGQDKLDFTILRDGKTINKNIELVKDPSSGQRVIGILPEIKVEKYSLIESFKESGKAYIELFKKIFDGLKMLIFGQVDKKDVAGPVGMVKIVGEASKVGASMIIWLVALLSINIGIFNLLPFPALDGGRIIFVLLEIVGIKVNKKLEERIHMVGMMVLLGLIVLITFNDVTNLFTSK